jgi:quinol-cytochrome oxidoreductase complex cytochrome b subunit
MASIVSGVIVVFLLVLYVYAIKQLVDKPTEEPTPQVATILTLVGGLVSALVVSVLAITPPGDNVARVFLDSKGLLIPGLAILSWAYLGVWFLCGAALVVKWMGTKGPAQTLRNAANTWLGLAVAAGWAYFKLKPN